MIIMVADVDGRKTLVVALNDQDLAELLDGRRLSVDVTGMLGSTPLRGILITGGETAIDLGSAGNDQSLK
jgi:hypothetical protein